MCQSLHDSPRWLFSLDLYVFGLIEKLIVVIFLMLQLSSAAFLFFSETGFFSRVCFFSSACALSLVVKPPLQRPLLRTWGSFSGNVACLVLLAVSAAGFGGTEFTRRPTESPPHGTNRPNRRYLRQTELPSQGTKRPNHKGPIFKAHFLIDLHCVADLFICLSYLANVRVCVAIA